MTTSVHKESVSTVKFFLYFSLIHSLTYLVVGLASFILFDYSQILQETDLYAQLFRPTDSPIVQAGVLIQLLRGVILAIPFYLYYPYLKTIEKGWLHIWLTLFILTSIGAVITGPGSIEGMIYTTLSFSEHIGSGYVEVILQTGSFAYLFWIWMKREERIINNLEQ